MGLVHPPPRLPSQEFKPMEEKPAENSILLSEKTKGLEQAVTEVEQDCLNAANQAVEGLERLRKEELAEKNKIQKAKRKKFWAVVGFPFRIIAYWDAIIISVLIIIISMLDMLCFILLAVGCRPEKSVIKNCEQKGQDNPHKNPCAPKSLPRSGPSEKNALIFKTH